MAETQSRSNRHHKKKKKNRFFKIVIYLLISVLITVVSYGGYLYLQAKQIIDDAYEEDSRDGSALREEKVDPASDHVSVLFIGVDQGGSRDTASFGLSDALILTTFNRQDKSIKMLSIPRDSYMHLPIRGKEDKITHAHAFGGPKATIDALESTFDIPIDYYISLNFNSFISIVDELGGIDVEVPYALEEMDANDVKGAITLEAGMQRLNGEEALALARTRRYDNDIQRGQRQQQIMQAIIKRAMSVSTVLNMGDLMQAAGRDMRTDMPFSDMRQFITYGLQTDLDIEQLQLQGSDLWTDAYYYQLDEEHLEEVKLDLQEHLDYP